MLFKLFQKVKPNNDTQSFDLTFVMETRNSKKRENKSRL
jgi:hypothetical protein